MNLTPPPSFPRSHSYDLMHSINTRGTFLCSKLCIPHLRKSSNGHILNISPPLDMSAKWFAPHVAYTMAKFGMSMCALGMAEELRDDGVFFLLPLSSSYAIQLPDHAKLTHTHSPP